MACAFIYLYCAYHKEQYQKLQNFKEIYIFVAQRSEPLQIPETVKNNNKSIYSPKGIDVYMWFSLKQS